MPEPVLSRAVEGRYQMCVTSLAVWFSNMRSEWFDSTVIS
jgi:hypothetical protein